MIQKRETAGREARVPPERFIDPRALPEAMPRPTAPGAATGLALVWAEAAVRPRETVVEGQAPCRPRGPVSRH